MIKIELYNQAKSGIITIPAAQTSYVHEFDKPIYDLIIEPPDEGWALSNFTIKLNEGDELKIYEFPIRYPNVEVYKITFIKQHTFSIDLNFHYQGFIK